MKVVHAILLFLLLATVRGEGETVNMERDQMLPANYNPAVILMMANRLIAAGEDSTYQSLLAYRPEETNHLGKGSEYYEYVMWLCVLLYEPKPGATLEVPLFGTPSFPFFRNQHQHVAAWPQFPLAFSHHTPFYIATGYALEGYTYSSSYYVGLYHRDGVFRTKPYPIPTREEAEKDLHELLNSTAWKGLDWRSSPMPGEKLIVESLQHQAERVSP